MVSMIDLHHISPLFTVHFLPYFSFMSHVFTSTSHRSKPLVGWKDCQRCQGKRCSHQGSWHRVCLIDGIGIGNLGSAWMRGGKCTFNGSVDHDDHDYTQVKFRSRSRRWKSSVMFNLVCKYMYMYICLCCIIYLNCNVQLVYGFIQPMQGQGYTFTSTRIESPFIASQTILPSRINTGTGTSQWGIGDLNSQRQRTVDAIGKRARLLSLTLLATMDGNDEDLEDNRATNKNETDTDTETETDEDIIESNQEEGVVLHDLNWRVEKMRLEEANTRRFLKSGPRFLPFEECRKWVIAFNRWDTEEEWRHWIEDGEKRNSYIPSSPDVYYGKRGEWKGWDHFLGVVEENENDDGEASAFQ